MSSSLLVWCCIGTLTGLAFGVENVLLCNFDARSLCNMIQHTDDVFDWTIQNFATKTTGTGPERGSGDGGEGFYIYIEASDPRIINDNARLTTDVLESGNWKLEFYYHATGKHIGVLNVFTREVGSEYHKLVWYHSRKFNASVAEWTKVQFSFTETSNFQVVFEGIRSNGPYGDIALDNINGYREGPSPFLPELIAFGLPFKCNFGDGDYCSMVTPYYTSQLDWQTNTGRTGSDNTGPSVDHTLGTDQGYYIYTEASTRDPLNNNLAGPGWRGIIATREFFPSCGQFSVDFWYHAYGDSVKRMMVLQEGYDTPLWDVGVTSKDEWINVQLSVNTTHPTKLLFVGEIGDTHTSDYALDDIAVEDCGCEESSNIDTTTTTAMSADIDTTTTTAASADIDTTKTTAASADIDTATTTAASADIDTTTTTADIDTTTTTAASADIDTTTTTADIDTTTTTADIDTTTTTADIDTTTTTAASADIDTTTTTADIDTTTTTHQELHQLSSSTHTVGLSTTLSPSTPASFKESSKKSSIESLTAIGLTTAVTVSAFSAVGHLTATTTLLLAAASAQYFCFLV